jgi:hypothetical protein
MCLESAAPWQPFGGLGRQRTMAACPGVRAQVMQGEGQTSAGTCRGPRVHARRSVLHSKMRVTYATYPVARLRPPGTRCAAHQAPSASPWRAQIALVNAYALTNARRVGSQASPRPRAAENASMMELDVPAPKARHVTRDFRVRRTIRRCTVGCDRFVSPPAHARSIWAWRPAHPSFIGKDRQRLSRSRDERRVATSLSGPSRQDGQLPVL